MSSQTIYFCDECHIRLNDHKYQVLFNRQDINQVGIHDLCQECFDELEKALPKLANKILKIDLYKFDV